MPGSYTAVGQDCRALAHRTHLGGPRRIGQRYRDRRRRRLAGWPGVARPRWTPQMRTRATGRSWYQLVAGLLAGACRAQIRCRLGRPGCASAIR